MTLRLSVGEEAAQCGIGVLLTQAVQIEPRVDLAPPFGNPFALARIEWCGRGHSRGRLGFA